MLVLNSNSAYTGDKKIYPVTGLLLDILPQWLCLCGSFQHPTPGLQFVYVAPVITQ